MSENSKIQWTDATWNIARGCTKVDEDCKFCYMYRDSMDSHRYNPLEIIRTKTVFDFPLRYKETKSSIWTGNPLIFTSSLTDFFHEAIDGYREEAWDIIRKCPHLTFQILTKRPHRIMDHLPADWGNTWDNVWFGTSIGSESSLKRMFDLRDVECSKKFISFEPLHGYIDANFDLSMIMAFDWIIIGGESGNENGKYRYRPCDLEWIRELKDSFSSCGVPVFVKQLGTYLAKQMGLKDRHGGDISEWPADIQMRQLPKPPKND